YTTATFADPTLIFESRPVRDGVGSGDVGDFTKPTVIARRKYGPQIMQEVLLQSADGSNPADGEGPMGIALGSFATGGASLEGAPSDWPMSIAQLAALLVDTGELDIVNTPVDSGGNMGQVSCYNGDYGANLTGTVNFQYATGTRNAIGCRRTTDLRGLCNKLWIYLGPRKYKDDDPAFGEQHWRANITADDPALNVAPYNPPQSTIIAARDASRAAHYVRMQIRIFDGNESAARDLYRRWWQMESWLRARPQTLVHVTPQRGIKPAFRTGDLIGVTAGSRFRGGFSGSQRVMEYTYRWDTEGVVELGEPVAMPGAPAVVTTADTEGLPAG
uniref:hypothetical protein n=1 Tax=Gaiella sp. TaxID=2663207 RepID=UPI0039836169